MIAQTATPNLDAGLWRALQCRVNHIRKAAPRLNTKNETQYRETRRLIWSQLYEIRVLCDANGINFLEYLKDKDIILVAKDDGRVDVHIA